MVEVINFNMFIYSNYEFALLCINEVDWGPTTPWRIHIAYEFPFATNPGSLEVSQSVLVLSTSFPSLNTSQRSGAPGNFFVMPNTSELGSEASQDIKSSLWIGTLLVCGGALASCGASMAPFVPGGCWSMVGPPFWACCVGRQEIFSQRPLITMQSIDIGLLPFSISLMGIASQITSLWWEREMVRWFSAVVSEIVFGF